MRIRPVELVGAVSPLVNIAAVIPPPRRLAASAAMKWPLELNNFVDNAGLLYKHDEEEDDNKYSHETDSM